MTADPASADSSVRASIVLPAIDEFDALRATVQAIESTIGPRLHELLFVVCPRTAPTTRALCESLVAASNGRDRLHDQRRPGLGSAVSEAFELATGSHVVLMATDLETDPALLAPMLDAAARDPSAVVTASRWAEGGAFVGYGRLRTLGNAVFQRAFAALYGVSLRDLTYGYRVFPTSLVKRVRWEESGHAMLFETLVKPLRLGVRVVEVPAVWRPRPEGRSSASPFAPLAYLRIGLSVRLRPRAAVVS